MTASLSDKGKQWSDSGPIRTNGLSATIFIQSEKHNGIEWKHETEQYKHDFEAHDKDANDLYRYKVVMMSALLKGLKNQAAFLRHKRLVRRLREAEVVIWQVVLFFSRECWMLMPGKNDFWNLEMFETSLILLASSAIGTFSFEARRLF